MKKHYSNNYFTIDFRKWYEVKIDGEWAGYWLHGDKECGCGDLEIIEKYKGEGIRRIPLWKTNYLHNFEWHIFLSGVIVGLLATYLLV